MTIVVKAYAKTDDVLIAWCPELSNDWMGFQLERNDATSDRFGQPHSNPVRGRGHLQRVLLAICDCGTPPA
jgi:hypothetical protein